MLPEDFKRKTLELKQRINKSNTVVYSNIRINKVYENKNKNLTPEGNNNSLISCQV